MKKLILILSVALMFIVSCTPTKTIVDTSCSGYKKINFSKYSIVKHNLAVMPVLKGDEKEQFRRPMGVAITKALYTNFQEENIISAEQVVQKLNKDTLITVYYNVIDNYKLTGIIDKQEISKLGASLNTKYLLFTKLLSAQKFAQIYTGGYYSYHASINELYIQTQIWDTEIGDVVWEGKGGIACLDCDNIINKVAVGLVNIIGLKAGQGSCEEPKEILESVQAATSQTYLGIALGSIVLSLLVLIGM